MDDWNIDDHEGKKILIELIKEVIKDKSVETIRLPYLIKKLSRKNNIIIKKNNKVRNINNYVKIKYGNMDRLLIELNHIFCVKNNKIEISNNYKDESQEYVFL
tara:strand:+ start:1277 stop:1585 length:309 start_codon:yes stop_codon:yes gene_type:complete